MSLWLLVAILATAGPTQTAAPSTPAVDSLGILGLPALAAPAPAVDSLGILAPPAPAPGRDLFAGFS